MRWARCIWKIVNLLFQLILFEPILCRGCTSKTQSKTEKNLQIINSHRIGILGVAVLNMASGIFETPPIEKVDLWPVCPIMRSRREAVWLLRLHATSCSFHPVILLTEYSSSNSPSGNLVTMMWEANSHGAGFCQPSPGTRHMSDRTCRLLQSLFEFWPEN